ncbi:MAG: NADH-quinone oxidoreductase subunit D [Streptosporangiales bacterium]|nr:NADH-quinone oxidoreductase subunit D [Streptosporangiales bacterium]
MTEIVGLGEVASLRDELARRLAGGQRFAGLYGADHDGGVRLTALVAADGDVAELDADLPADAAAYPALTPSVPAAFWYEREIHDLFGVAPDGHPRLDPLVLPLLQADPVRPRPGAEKNPQRLDPDEHALPRHVMGPGVFTIPHGPVRSGVFESVEYLVETPGEDIPHLNIRVFYKHRGIEKRFEHMAPADGVLLAERVEGIASVAHALAYCHALERLAGCVPPWPAQLVRVLYAELERIANHLDAALKLADAAGLAVAVARFGWHKERVLRLVGRLAGNRFGRGVVVPGGVSRLPALGPAAALAELNGLQRNIDVDAALLMGTSSFLDRLRTTGPLPADRARAHGALGPVGKASGHACDARDDRPYDAYPTLGAAPRRRYDDGDALARLRVRWDEVRESFHLLRQVVDQLDDIHDPTVRAPVEVAGGRAVGWAEAPQGEVLYAVQVTDGRVARCKPRSASFHNLVLFHEVFVGDILTDFPFSEASFGLSIAGVAL